MRPRGSYGEVAQALLRAASAAPGPVRVLAERAQVGYQAAYVACTRLRQRGDLVPLCEDQRPVVLTVPDDEAANGAAGAALERVLRAWQGA